MKQKLPLLILLLAIFIFYSPLLFLNFVQDDFFFLLTSKAGSLKDLIVFFTPTYSFVTTHFPFYRPLTTQFYFGLMQLIFGLQPFFFHLASLGVHLLNVLLVYRLARLFFPKAGRLLPWLSAAIYGFSQNHIVTIGWASNIQELGVTSFILLTLIFYKKNFVFSSLIFFILALCSKETAITLPILLFLVNRNFKKLIPFILILLPYLYFHFIKFSFSEPNYPMVINWQAFNTLAWYVWWGIGLPEMFLDYVGSKFSLAPNLWRYFAKEAMAILSLFGLLSVTLATAVFTKIKKFSFFFLAFYLIFLLPVLFFPQNKYPYHQTTALAGLAIFLAGFLASSKKIIIAIFIILFMALQVFSLNLTLRTNPLVQRSKLATLNLDTFRLKYPTLPANSVIFVKNDPDYPKINDIWGGTANQLSYAISGENSFKLFYGNSTRVYFEGKDSPPKDFTLAITAIAPH